MAVPFFDCRCGRLRNLFFCDQSARRGGTGRAATRSAASSGATDGPDGSIPSRAPQAARSARAECSQRERLHPVVGWVYFAPSSVRSGIVVENIPVKIKAPSGAAYSAPDGAENIFGIAIYKDVAPTALPPDGPNSATAGFMVVLLARRGAVARSATDSTLRWGGLAFLPAPSGAASL